MTAYEFSTALRRIADFYDAHQDLPVPHDSISIFGSPSDDLETVQRVAHTLGTARKEMGDTTFSLAKDFGGVSLAFIWWRSTVCVRRVVGTRVVPAQPEREVEVVEWDCPAILEETTA